MNDRDRRERPDDGAPRKRREGSPYRGDRNDGPRSRRDDAGGRFERRDGGQRREGGYRQDRDDRGPRREGGYRDDRGGQRPQRDERRPYRGDRDDRGGQRPQRDGGQRREGGYRQDRDDRGPRREGGYRQDRDDRGPRREGGYRDDRGGQRDERRPYRGDREDRGPRREGGYRDDRGGQRPQRDGGQRRDGGYRQDRDDRGPRREGGYRDDRGGQRDERRPYRGDRDDRGPRREGGFRQDRADRGPRRDGGREQRSRESYGRGGTRGGGRSDRGGQGREYTEAERLQHELRPVRAEHDDPILPDEVSAKDLHPAARNELKTLQVDLQDRVARHLAMVAFLIDDDPELAHQHALSASRRAGRIPVARETLAITAYRTGDFALALRELRTHRRLSGRVEHVALMVDCERGLGRPEKAIETGHEIDTSTLATEERVHLAIAMSGARLDLGQTQQALFELEIPELNPKKAFSWSPDLFAAYAAVLEDLGRDSEAKQWLADADRAAAALAQHHGGHDELEVFEILEVEPEPEYAADDEHDVEAAAAPEPEPATEQADPAPAAEPEPAEDAEPAPEPELSFTDAIEAEVAELLADAGITDTDDDAAEETTK